MDFINVEQMRHRAKHCAEYYFPQQRDVGDFSHIHTVVQNVRAHKVYRTGYLEGMVDVLNILIQRYPEYAKKNTIRFIFDLRKEAEMRRENI